MGENNRKYYIETRVLFLRVSVYIAIDNLSYRKTPLKNSELYASAGEFFFMRGKDVCRSLNKYPHIKSLDKKTAMKMLKERSPLLFKVAHIDRLEKYYNRNRGRTPDPELDIIIPYGKRYR